MGKWWWAIAGVILGALAISQLVEQFRGHRSWVVAVALAMALVGSFVAYHRVSIRSSTGESRQDVARTLLEGATERGRQIAGLTGSNLVHPRWHPWDKRMRDLLDEMFGAQRVSEFAAAGPGPGTSPPQWAAGQVAYLETVLALDPLPLLADWKPQ